MSGTLITTMNFPASDSADASAQYDALIGSGGALSGDTILAHSFFKDIKNSGAGQLIVVVSELVNTVADASPAINTRQTDIGSATITSANLSTIF